MSWLEAKHRRSEEKAEKLQSEEIEKIQVSRANNYENVSNLDYDKYGVSVEQLELPYAYLSDETCCSDYGTDTYRLAKEIKLCGRIIKLDTISPEFVRKHNLYDNLTRTPASPRFPSAVKHSPLLYEVGKNKHMYNYKSCYMPSSDAVNVLLGHIDSNRVEYKNRQTMPDGLPTILNEEFKIVSEKDFSDIRIFFLLAASV